MIANADAGSTEEESIDAALAVLREHADVELASTASPDELDDVLRRTADGKRTIVVAGGDGSLHAVVAALHRHGTLADQTLALLPLGTGNDFARSLGLPLDAADAAQAIVAGTPRQLDLIVDDQDEVVVNAVHAGASAEASRAGAVWKERLGRFGLGIAGYPVGAAVAALRPTATRLRVEVDGEPVVDNRPVLMVAVSNGTSVGGGTELTPEAEPHDGQADVMISLATGPLARFGYAWRLRGGEHEDRDDVIARRARSVSVSGERFWLSADGELSGPFTRRSWQLKPKAYTMIVP